MAWTQEDLNCLNEAIAQGAKKVKYADKEVEYRSLNEMLKLRDIMKEELGLKKGKRYSFANFSKGFNNCPDEGTEYK